MFSRVISSMSDHFIFSIIAHPSFSTCVLMFVGAIKALFIRKAMPADPRGFSGSLELVISKFLLKHLLMSPSLWSSRWVSCSARMAIFSVLIVLFIVIHLSIWFIPCVGAVALFRFSVAIFIFALFVFFRTQFPLV